MIPPSARVSRARWPPDLPRLPRGPARSSRWGWAGGARDGIDQTGSPMTASLCCVDHIVVTAPDLVVGVKHVSDTLGVPMQPGGEHPDMATHNWLLRLGDAVFLEVIAPNPAAPRPPRRRWYALDDETPATLPRLAGWVARSSDVRAAAAAASESLGHVEALRRGALRWLLTVPGDGSLPMGGGAPPGAGGPRGGGRAAGGGGGGRGG